MATFSVSTANGAVRVEADEWQIDSSGCLGFFSGGMMVANFWRPDWDGDAPAEVMDAVNDNAPVPAAGVAPGQNDSEVYPPAEPEPAA